MASEDPVGNEREFPSISSAVQLLPPTGHLGLSRSDLIATHSASVSARAGLVEAFHLVLIFHLLISNHEKSGNVSLSRTHNALDVWHDLQRRKRRKENLELLAGELLEYISRAVDHERSLEIEDILYATFHFDSSQSRMICVMDLLPHPGIPSEMLLHPLVTVAMSKLWKYGRAYPSPDGLHVSYLQRCLAVYDSASAPRIQHAVHLAFHLGYLVLLAHLILYPAPLPLLVETPGGPIGVREPLIAVYSIANIFSGAALSLFVLPHVLVLISFLFSLPASPSPGSVPYTTLLCALCFHILFLQLPVPPGPVFLVDPGRSLPLSSLYSTFFGRCLFPIVTFFLPVILTSTVLLSISLFGAPLHGVWTLDFFASPPAARLAFLGLLGLALFHVTFFSAFVLLVAPSSISAFDTFHGHWEVYGTDAGLSGRRALIRAIKSYSPSSSGAMNFPPPLNILSHLLNILPLSRRTRMITWRVVVGPLAFSIAAFWCWGLL